MGDFLSEWGYVAVYLATTIEGEFAYISAVVASRLGHLGIVGVGIAAFFGGMTRDLLIFFGSRYGGRKLIKKKPELQAKLDHTSIWMSSRPWYFLAFHRYIYGLSTATIIVLSMSKMTNFSFILLTIIACLVWVLGYGLLGYYAADTVMSHLDWLKNHFHWILGGVILIVLSYKGYVKYYAKS